MRISSKAISNLAASTAAAGVLALSGCQVAPSKTVSGAGTGAVAGAVGGAIIGNNTGSGNAAQGAVIGGAAGAAVGAVVGMVQEARERSEQERLAQERAYQQELAKRRAAEAKFRAAIDEQLAIAEGYRISDQELSQVEDRAKDLEARLQVLQAEREAAKARKRALDTAQGRIASAEQEIEALEAELAELRGDAPVSSTALAGNTTAAKLSFVEHRVSQGETLDSIAAKYKVPISRIRESNNLPASGNLTPGQVLQIPVAPATRSASSRS